MGGHSDAFGSGVLAAAKKSLSCQGLRDWVHLLSGREERNSYDKIPCLRYPGLTSQGIVRECLISRQKT